jgi:hypothetical protein
MARKARFATACFSVSVGHSPHGHFWIARSSAMSVSSICARQPGQNPLGQVLRFSCDARSPTWRNVPVRQVRFYYSQPFCCEQAGRKRNQTRPRCNRAWASCRARPNQWRTQPAFCITRNLCRCMRGKSLAAEAQLKAERTKVLNPAKITHAHGGPALSHARLRGRNPSGEGPYERTSTGATLISAPQGETLSPAGSACQGCPSERIPGD